jgi:hypothetical protein
MSSTFPSLLLLFVAATGCAGNTAAKRMQVADRFSDGMAAPSRPLEEFGRFEILPITMEPAVSSDERKAQVADQLDDRLRTRLAPMITKWTRPEGKTLRIQPHVVELRIVSGGSRFWLGAMAGDSHLDMDLILLDGESNEQVGHAIVRQEASGMSGAWSVGGSDRNLLNYITDIIYAYLHKHHSATRSEPLIPGDEDK